MGQTQASHDKGRSMRFPTRVVILVVVIVAATTLYVQRLGNEQPYEVLIHVVGEDVQQVQTVGGTVQDILEQAGVEFGPHDRVAPDLAEYVSPDLQITLERATPIQVLEGGAETEHWVIAQTVGEALTQVGITVGSLDRVTPGRGTAIVPGMTVQIVRVTEEFIEETQTLPFKVLRWAAPELEQGHTRVIREGQEGIIRNTVRVVYEDGRAVNRTIVSSEVVQNVVDRVIGEGTRVPSRTVDTPDGPIPYVEVREMEATGYEPGPISTGEWSDGLTFTGLRATRGVVAVDPTVIPLGTKLYIEGYGEGIAADIGGAIKGNRIDLCFDTYEEAIQWGRRVVKVYILAN